MKLYSDFPGRRAWQLVADVAATAGILVAIALGTAVGGAIASLGRLGAELERAGSGFTTSMTQVGESLSGIPLIGGGVAGPFQGAADAGESVRQAGATLEDTLVAMGVLAGIAIAAGPILVVLALWLVPRLRFALRAGRAQAIARAGGPLDILALRALVSRPPGELERIHPAPAAAWRAGDPDAIHALAALELARAGVRLGGPA